MTTEWIYFHRGMLCGVAALAVFLWLQARALRRDSKNETEGL